MDWRVAYGGSLVKYVGHLHVEARKDPEKCNVAFRQLVRTKNMGGKNNRHRATAPSFVVAWFRIALYNPTLCGAADGQNTSPKTALQTVPCLATQAVCMLTCAAPLLTLRRHNLTQSVTQKKALDKSSDDYIATEEWVASAVIITADAISLTERSNDLPLCSVPLRDISMVAQVSHYSIQ